MTQGDTTMVMIPEDGKITATLVMALQRMLKNAGTQGVGPVDGRMGRRTTNALKMYLQAQGYEVGMLDGRWDPTSIEGMQQWLWNGGFYCGEIDGVFSAATIQALQSALNAITAQVLWEGTRIDMNAADRPGNAQASRVQPAMGQQSPAVRDLSQSQSRLGHNYLQPPAVQARVVQGPPINATVVQARVVQGSPINRHGIVQGIVVEPEREP